MADVAEIVPANVVPVVEGDVPIPAESGSVTLDGADSGAASTPAADSAEAAPPKVTYPLKVSYCKVCTLPAEVHEYVSRSQFEKCKPWLRTHAAEHFPDLFPDECAARLEALKLSAESGEVLEPDEDDDISEVKVAVPIEQKTSGGKKKKAAAEIVLMLGQRKGKKQVTIVYGLDLFGIKLKDAAKAAKRKFATGSSVTTSPDCRAVIEIQGARQEDFGLLAHKEFGIPKEVIFLVNPQKKKVRVFPAEK